MSTRDRNLHRRRVTLTLCVVAVLVAVRVIAVVVALDGDATRARGHTVLPGDVRRFHKIAQHEGVPYRDFKVEYPPLTVAAIDVIDGATVRDTTVRLMWSQLVLDLLVALLLAWGWGRRAALSYLVLGLAFVWYPFLYLRLDLLSVALAVLGYALVRKGRGVLGGVGLAVACFVKVWPAALVAALIARRAWRGVAAFTVTASAGLVAWVVSSGVDGPVQVFTYRGAVGWQAESSVGAAMHLWDGGRALMDHGAARLGVVPDWAVASSLLVAAIIIVAITLLASRVPKDEVAVHDGLVPLALLTTMLVTATILSPQYASWLLPFAAIAAARRERSVAVLTFVIAASSTLDLNLIKEVNAGDSIPMAIVVIRNILLVALLATALVRIAHARRDARALPAIWDRQDLDALALSLPVTAAPSASTSVSAAELEDVARRVMPDAP